MAGFLELSVGDRFSSVNPLGTTGLDLQTRLIAFGFEGVNDGSRWVSVWYGCPARLGGVRIENLDDVACRVPEWRVASGLERAYGFEKISRDSRGCSKEAVPCGLRCNP